MEVLSLLLNSYHFIILWNWILWRRQIVNFVNMQSANDQLRNLKKYICTSPFRVRHIALVSDSDILIFGNRPRGYRLDGAHKSTMTKFKVRRIIYVFICLCDKLFFRSEIIVIHSGFTYRLKQLKCLYIYTLIILIFSSFQLLVLLSKTNLRSIDLRPGNAIRYLMYIDQNILDCKRWQVNGTKYSLHRDTFDVRFIE